jgi:predicted transcriptional regulator
LKKEKLPMRRRSVSRTSVFTKSIDAHELETHYSNEQKIPFEELKTSSLKYEDFVSYIDMLPPREADLIDLFYKLEKTQKDIAKMFGVTQGAVSSRLARAKQRLKFIRDLPKIEDHKLEQDLGGFFEPLEVEIIKNMKSTTCQSKTASLLNEKYRLKDPKAKMTQVKVRHRFEKCLQKLNSLRGLHPQLEIYHRLVSYLKKNPYMMHQVNLPHFDRGEVEIYSVVS